MKKKKQLKGVMVVEMACMGAFFVMMLVSIVLIFFYYYDKSVLQGVAFETMVYGAERYREGEEEPLEEYFQERIRDKTILFGKAKAEIEKKGEFLVIHARMTKGQLKTEVVARSTVLRPEDQLREKRKWTKQLK